MLKSVVFDYINVCPYVCNKKKKEETIVPYNDTC